MFFNAGFGRFQPLEGVRRTTFDAQFAVNVRGPLLQAQALAPLLNDGAALLLNTSIARDKGFAATAIYASTKGAVRTLTRVLARELAPRRIRVNAVSPGPIETTSSSAPACRRTAIDEFGAAVLSRGAAGSLGQARGSRGRGRRSCCRTTRPSSPARSTRSTAGWRRCEP